jgi:hypothetical protein
MSARRTASKPKRETPLCEWLCKDGRIIAIEDMDTSHLTNCVAKIRRSSRGWRKQYLEPMVAELESRAQNMIDDPQATRQELIDTSASARVAPSVATVRVIEME